ncbi:polysaccharide biosynthesis/export family protein [Proteus terrae]|nr:polysaccharide biosynthesis/export family protein [Proteus terrae]MCO4182524.1 polysaccharide biosynthesis/export family protein [Proteus terrae]MCO4188276.1 polysaccharide biosynthesis/export family protein [Proteus terrae]
MELKKHLLIAVLLPTILAGCTIVPGSHLSPSDKNVVQSESDQDDNISDQVNVYPLDAHNVSRYQQHPDFRSRANADLDALVAAYEYKVGPGDILNVTIWDHPELTIPAGSYRSASEAGNWVHSDGTIFYPYIGTVAVAGKTVREIRAVISERLSKYIESPQVDNLDIMTRGQVPPNPSELLMHPRFKELMEWASELYDLVIVDTPPVLAVTDSSIVGALAGTTLMVARFGMNTVKEIDVARNRFEQSGIEVKGVILNATEKKALSYYGYGYYNYSYKSES